MMPGNPSGSLAGRSRISGKSPFLILLVFMVIVGSGCRRTPEPVRETRFMMGTLVEILVYARGEDAANAVNRAFSRMAEVEKATSCRIPGNDVESVREGAGALFSGDAARILQTALSTAIASSGAFDPTLGELVDLWGIGTDRPRVPGEAGIRDALGRSGYHRIPESGRFPPGEIVWLDLGGVAKGYAVDEAVRVLKDSGVGAGIVDAGGDLRTFGVKPGSSPWRVGVQDPDESQELAGILEAGEISIATSGDYQRYFEVEGVRYHHILDPATGRPARSGLKSVTVLAPDCALADALATAAFVMGPERGLDLLEKRDGVEGILISEDGMYHMTSGIGTRYPFRKQKP